MGMNGYKEIYNMGDIFNNKDFATVLPQFKVKDKEEQNKVSVTSGKSVYGMVKMLAKEGARPYYKPLKVTSSNMRVVISGNLISTHDEAFLSVFNNLKSNKQLLEIYANNRDILRNALKFTETKALRQNVVPKLYLMSKYMANPTQITKDNRPFFLTEINQNLLYSDEFLEFRKRFGWDKLSASEFMALQEKMGIPNNMRATNYNVGKDKWQGKVGQERTADFSDPEYQKFARENPRYKYKSTKER